MQRFEKDFYFAVHQVAGTGFVPGQDPIFLDVPTLDREKLNYVKFGHILGALGYASIENAADKELLAKLWGYLIP
jgi:hypothetical protein